MHLTTEAALDWIEERMEGAHRTFWSDHFRQCEACAQEVKTWGVVRTGLPGRHLVSAPSGTIEGAEAVFRKPESGLGRVVRAVAAALVFDSLVTPGFAGARGAGTARQIVLEAPEVDIHFKIWMDEDRRRMSGQILPRGSSGFLPVATIHLVRGRERLDSSATDAFGEFHLVDVPEGSVGIQIDLPHMTVMSVLEI